MFKDFMKSIFNEEVDLDEELEEEVVEDKKEVEEKPEPKPESEPKLEPEVKEEPVVVAPEPTQVSFTPVQPAPVAQPESSFMDLSVDDVAKEEPLAPSHSTYHYDRKKLHKPVRRSTPEVEYQAVISPIFGNQDEKEKDFSKVHDAIRLEQPLSDPSFEQVISPMYGSDLPTVKPLEEVPMKNPGKAVEVQTEIIDLSEMLDKPKDKTAKQDTLIKD